MYRETEIPLNELNKNPQKKMYSSTEKKMKKLDFDKTDELQMNKTLKTIKYLPPESPTNPLKYKPQVKRKANSSFSKNKKIEALSQVKLDRYEEILLDDSKIRNMEIDADLVYGITNKEATYIEDTRENYDEYGNQDQEEQEIFERNSDVKNPQKEASKFSRKHKGFASKVLKYTQISPKKISSKPNNHRSKSREVQIGQY
jgi:hypothetical protein